MKGLSDEAYRQLTHLAEEGHELVLEHGDPRIELNADLVTQRRVLTTLEDDPNEPERPWLRTAISPLGRLALKLWPAIREG